MQTTQPSSDNQELLLKQDGTFTYSLFLDVAGNITFNGKWTVTQNVLILEETPAQAETREDKSFLQENTTNATDKTIVVYDLKDSTLVAGADVEANDSGTWIPTNANGVSKLPNIKIKTICVKFLTKTRFSIVNPNANYFSAYVTIKSPDPLFKSMPTSRWLVKKRRFIGLRSDGKREENNELTRQRDL